MQRPQADETNEEGLIRGKSALHQVLEAVVKIEKGKVITGPADSVGLILYNVDVKCSALSPGTFGADHILARQVRSIVVWQLQARDIRLPEPPNDQCRRDQEGHQTDGSRQRAISISLAERRRGHEDCAAGDPQRDFHAVSEGQGTECC